MIVLRTVQWNNLVTQHFVTSFGVRFQGGNERIFEVTDRAEISLEGVALQVLQQGLEMVELHRAVRTGVRHQGVVEVALEKMISVLGGRGTTVATARVPTAIQVMFLQTWLYWCAGTGLLLEVF